MSRGRESFKRLFKLGALAACCVAVVAAGCIFSPPHKPCVGCQEGPIKTPEDLITALKNAYQTRNYDAFAALLSAEPGAEYLFILNAPDPDTGELNWDLTEELRIHRRMFNPENVPPGDPQVPAELWLASIDIQLTQQGSFTERPDLYRSDANPEGLDPATWKAMECVYGTYVLFDTQGELDYRVDGRATFIVIENLKKSIGDAGKFLIYRWEDMGSPKPVSGPAA